MKTEVVGVDKHSVLYRQELPFSRDDLFVLLLTVSGRFLLVFERDQLELFPSLVFFRLEVA